MEAQRCRLVFVSGEEEEEEEKQAQEEEEEDDEKDDAEQQHFIKKTQTHIKALKSAAVHLWSRTSMVSYLYTRCL